MVDHRSAEPLVVVAHPDDEILWLAPAASAASAVVVTFPMSPQNPDLDRPRLAVRARYPLGGLQCLPLRGAKVHRASDWARRSPTTRGVELLPNCPTGTTATYGANYDALLGHLAPYVQACPEVYTHNPWGEYGHEEHVQVSNAVVELASRYGRSVWAWDGFPERRLLREGTRLRRDYYHGTTASLPRRTLDVDLDLYREIRRLYIECGAWTWELDYEPPAPSTYLQLVDRGQRLAFPAPQKPALWEARVAATEGSLAARRAASWTARGARGGARRVARLLGGLAWRER